MVIHNKHISSILRILVGLVFATSAILKYVSIDAFDLFVYEHNLFSVSATETLTRLLITAEAVLGVTLVLNLHARVVYYAVWGSLATFTVYMLLLPVLFDVNAENCYCFGETIVLNRTQSIIKNLTLMVCLVFVSRRFYIRKKWETQLTAALSVAILVVAFVVKAPGYLYTAVHREKIQIDASMYEAALLNSGKEEKFVAGKQIICMYSVSCMYCRKSALKLNLLLKNNNLSADNVRAIFWSDTPHEAIHEFFYEQNIFLPEYTMFRADTFLLITNGRMPVFLFSDNGKILHKANYITLSEKDVVRFLGNNLESSNK